PPSPTPFPYTTLFRSAGPTQSLGGSSRRAPVVGSRGPVSCGAPARALKSHSANQRSWTLAAAKVQPAAIPPLLTHSRRCNPSKRSEEHTSELQSRFDL